ncbi:MAG: YdbL family protein [Rhodanobacteraceae bacterium]
MRRQWFPIVLSMVLLAGCVTVNVYFPAAQAQQAADQVIGNIMGSDSSGATPAPAASTHPAPTPSAKPASSGLEPLAARVVRALIPAAYAAEPQVNLHIQTPAIQAIEARMRTRFQSIMRGLLQSGAVGFTNNGDVAIRDASKIPLAERSQATQAVAQENADRAELYKQIAIANGHPEWAQRMRETFARQWISRERPGWYYQDASGKWQQKS